MPVIGFLGCLARHKAQVIGLAAFRQGLAKPATSRAKRGDPNTVGAGSLTSYRVGADLVARRST
jgi:hypothetical protein